MKREYDFSKAKRGAVLQHPPGKTRITIRIDEDILDWFRSQVEASGGGNYQTLINLALRQYVESRRPHLEDTLRKVIREELRAAQRKARTRPSIGPKKTPEAPAGKGKPKSRRG